MKSEAMLRILAIEGFRFGWLRHLCLVEASVLGFGH